jgi:signal transduction histidine kinase/CheY-like chemotaxis protein
MISNFTEPINNDVHEWEASFYNIFNEAYQSYLNNSSSILFINILLDKIINITKSESGFISSINKVNDCDHMCIDAICNKIWDKNEIVVPKNMMFDLSTKSICSYSVKLKKIIITNDVLNHPWHNETFTGYTNVKTFASIPFYFNDECKGIIGLANRSFYDESMIPPLKILANLVGLLNTMCTKNKKTSVEVDSRFITYQLMEEILNATNDGFLITNNQYKIIFANQCISEEIKCDYKLDIILGKNIADIFEQLSILIDSNINNVDNTSKIYRNRKLNIINNTKEIMINSALCHGSVYHIFTIRDIVDKMYKNDNMQKKQNNFIGFLSHELRNPLQSVTLSHYLLQHEIVKNNITTPKIKDHIKTMDHACADMKKIINDVLDLSRIEAKEFSIDIENCNIRDIVEYVVSEHEKTAQEKEIKILYNFDENIPINLLTDEVRINQILSNLVSNAIKYSLQSDDSSIKLNVSFNETDNMIAFDVVDNGIGIRADEVHNLFKKYGQTTNNFKLNCSSNGLGLCVSQKLAHLLGGYISVKSECNKGSIFTLYHPTKLGRKISRSEKSMASLNLKGTILIVDDNESNLILLKMLMEHFNYNLNYDLEVHAVTNGGDAIKICGVNKYDVIFMDINMFGLDGCTTCNMIKQNGYMGYVIATTGNILAIQENRITSSKYDCFDDIIIKPYDDTKILTTLSKYIIGNTN